MWRPPSWCRSSKTSFKMSFNIYCCISACAQRLIGGFCCCSFTSSFRLLCVWLKTGSENQNPHRRITDVFGASTVLFKAKTGLQETQTLTIQLKIFQFFLTLVSDGQTDETLSSCWKLQFAHKYQSRLQNVPSAGATDLLVDVLQSTNKESGTPKSVRQIKTPLWTPELSPRAFKPTNLLIQLDSNLKTSSFCCVESGQKSWTDWSEVCSFRLSKDPVRTCSEFCVVLTGA